MNNVNIKILLGKLADDAVNLAHDIDSKHDIETVSERYAQLKKEIKSIFRKYDKNPGNEDEMAFLFPAAQEAYIALKVPAGSSPSQKMASCLSDAEDLLSYYHGQM